MGRVADRSGHGLSGVLHQRLLALLGRDDPEAGAAIADALAQARDRVTTIQRGRQTAEQVLAVLVARRESSLVEIASCLREIHALGRDLDELAPLLARLEQRARELTL
jgi:hypothetical protein